MKYEEKLFIETFDDLKEKISSNDSYKIMKSTGLIRLLFLEGNLLVDRVNTKHIKIQFLLPENIDKRPNSCEEFTPTYSCIVHQLDPDCPLLSGMVQKKVSRDKFFRKKNSICCR